jgi:hypothetical protein
MQTLFHPATKTQIPKACFQNGFWTQRSRPKNLDFNMRTKAADHKGKIKQIPGSNLLKAPGPFQPAKNAEMNHRRAAESAQADERGTAKISTFGEGGDNMLLHAKSPTDAVFGFQTQSGEWGTPWFQLPQNGWKCADNVCHCSYMMLSAVRGTGRTFVPVGLPFCPVTNENERANAARIWCRWRDLHKLSRLLLLSNYHRTTRNELFHN